VWATAAAAPTLTVLPARPAGTWSVASGPAFKALYRLESDIDGINVEDRTDYEARKYYDAREYLERGIVAGTTSEFTTGRNKYGVQGVHLNPLGPSICTSVYRVF
jgi:hypothetical protein